MSLNSWLK